MRPIALALPLVLASLALVLAGCGDSEAAATPPDTPEAVFDRAMKAAEVDDWKTFAACLTPAAQERMAAMALMAASFAVMGEGPEAEAELAALLARHGIESAEAADPAAIADKPAFVQDVFGFFAKHGETNKETAPFIGRLEGVSIDGDRATGRIVNARGKASDVAFEKVDGRWAIEPDFGMN